MQNEFDELKINQQVIDELMKFCMYHHQDECMKILDSDEYLQKLLNKEISSWVGYYESLASIPEEKRENLLVGLMPHNGNPLMYTDLLIKRKGLNAKEQVLAEKVAEFLISPSLMADLLLGLDQQQDQPCFPDCKRYFLPAMEDPFNLFELDYHF